MRNILNVLHALSLTMLGFSTILLFPLCVSLYFEDGAHNAFLFSLGIALGASALLWKLTSSSKDEINPRNGLLLVSLVWLVFPLIASLPFVFDAYIEGHSLTFTHAYYEAMSGLTTTGASVLNNISELPPSVNIWRVTLIWVGGMGILVMAVAIMPLLGVGGHQVMRGEIPGPMKEEKLTPRIAGTAKALYAIYITASAICVLCYHFAGLSWFDAWCHAASTMALGGFSIYDEGFQHYDSPLVDTVACVFMMFAGINFATHYNVLRFRSLRYYLTCPETKIFLFILLLGGVVVSTWLYVDRVYPTLGEAFRFGMFNTISLATTTGFANTDYLHWPVLLPVMMLLLGSFSSSAGSTGGGIKLIRVILILKQIRAELRKLLHPHAICPVRLRNRIVPPAIVSSIMTFVLVFVIMNVVLTGVMVISGLDLTTASSAVFASLSNIGPGLGTVGPMSNYAHLSNFQMWICTFAMLIGRLEFFTILVLFTPGFWKK